MCTRLKKSSAGVPAPQPLTDFDEDSMSVQSVREFMAAAADEGARSGVITLRAREGLSLNLLRLLGPHLQTVLAVHACIMIAEYQQRCACIQRKNLQPQLYVIHTIIRCFGMPGLLVCMRCTSLCLSTCMRNMYGAALKRVCAMPYCILNRCRAAGRSGQQAHLRQGRQPGRHPRRQGPPALGVRLPGLHAARRRPARAGGALQRRQRAGAG